MINLLIPNDSNNLSIYIVFTMHMVTCWKPRISGKIYRVNFNYMVALLTLMPEGTRGCDGCEILNKK